MCRILTLVTSKMQGDDHGSNSPFVDNDCRVEEKLSNSVQTSLPSHHDVKRNENILGLSLIHI